MSRFKFSPLHLLGAMVVVFPWSCSGGSHQSLPDATDVTNETPDPAEDAVSPETTGARRGDTFADDSRARIDAIIESAETRVAVFDADGTLWYDDIGEAFFRWLIANDKLPTVKPGSDPWADYEALCAIDTGACYASLGPIMAGVAESDLDEWAAAFFAENFTEKIFPAQRALIEQLTAAGWDVWIVTASNKWIVRAAAPALGVPPDRVVGIAVEVDDGVLTDRQIEPVTYRQGKVEAIAKYIKARPALVAGNSMTDYEMLAYANDLAIVINPKSNEDPAKDLAKLAADAGWVVERW